MREALDKFPSCIPGKDMSLPNVLKCATNIKEKKYIKGQNNKEYMLTVLHLSMQAKGFTNIENLTHFPNLKVLHLFDNKI